MGITDASLFFYDTNDKIARPPTKINLGNLDLLTKTSELENFDYLKRIR